MCYGSMMVPRRGIFGLLESLGMVLVALNWGNKSVNHGLVV